MPLATRIPVPRVLLCAALAALAALASLAAGPAHALRLVDYNILNYPGSTGAARAPHFRTVLDSLDADVLVTEEMASPTSNTQFLNDVLEVLEPGQWATAPFVDGNDTDAALFYKPARVAFLGQWAFYPNPANQLRYIHVYRIKPAGYASDAAELRIYAAHLKASDTSADRAQRLAECTGIRDSMNAMPPGTRAVLAGDLNFYRQSTEPGYAKLLEDQADDTGRLVDVLGGGEWHDSAAWASVHTQSPCLTSPCASGAATGGMDDRFDFILPTAPLVSGPGMTLVPGSMRAAGNDGLHLNLNLTDLPVIPEGAAYAAALKAVSDHLPLRVDLRLPARLAADAALAFGSAIVGGAVTRTLAVSNPAPAPADSLDYALAAPPGFTAPAGPFALAAGAPAAAHVIGMSTAVPGALSGDLVLTSDAPDDPARPVPLSGTVLDHAQASLDSLAVVTNGVLVFEANDPGAFEPVVAAVHNVGGAGSRARLQVSAAAIDGGDGRFAVPGFAPALVGGTAARWDVTFDTGGATWDSTYEATLTFTCADEDLPGAAPQPALHVLLRARVQTPTPVAAGEAPPATTRLLPPAPNPLPAGGTLRFELAHATAARLEVFDLSGRRVRVLADRAFAAGRHGIPWDGRTDDGTRAGPGLYFVRLSPGGAIPRTARLVVVR